MSKEVKVLKYPPCDICRVDGVDPIEDARYDGKTISGPWAYMCELHFSTQGIGLGTGKGQRLILEKK